MRTVREQHDPVLVTRCQRTARVFSIIAVVAGASIATAWLLGFGEIAKFPGLAAMKMNTAVCIVLCGAALFMLQREKRERRRGVARLFAGAAAAAGLLTLFEYVFNISLGLDQALISDYTASAESPNPGRMGPNTSACALLIGTALIAFDSRPASRVRPAEVLALFAVVIAFLAIVGYMFAVPELSGTSLLTQMSPLTAMCFLLLGCGVVAARPVASIASIIVSSGLGGVYTRRMLLVALAVPVCLGWLRLLGEEAGWFGPRMGLSLFVVSMVLALVASTLCVAFPLDRAERTRRAAEEQFRRLLDATPDAMVIAGGDGRIALVNAQTERLFGYSRTELIGSPVELLIPKRYHANHPQHLAGYFADPRVRMMGSGLTLYGRRKDGGEFPVEISLSPLQTDEGRLVLSAIRDVTQTHKAQEALNSLNRDLSSRSAQLEAANKELEAFSYSVSHDLRAPLRHISGFVELLEKQAAATLDDKSRRYLGIVADSSTQMARLIDDLLAFSRMGRAELRHSSVNLDELTQSVIQDMRQEIAGRAVTWNINTLPEVRGDPAMLRQALVNLIGNAVKYTRTREQARIDIGLHATDGGEHIFIVRDNGVGFDMQYADKLFGVFQRLHRADEFEGTGIGLANVRRIVSRHGGRVWAQSKPDEGAAFYFTLPVA